MIDQDQARKFWANWVRREIGGNDMIQEAAVSAAVNELLQGRDNQAAADAARRTAQSLGVGVSTPHPNPAHAGNPATLTPLAPPQGGRESVATPITSVGSVPVGQAGQPLVCKLCGSTPAANMTIHEHNGRLLWMVHKTNKGPFCRDCGTALLRHHQNSTLYQGWFGIFSFFITPITLLLNLGAWRKVKALGPPQRDPNIESKIPAPLSPGKPLLRRPGPYVAGAVVAAVIVFFGIRGADTGGCLDSQKTLGNRQTRLHNAFVEVYNRDFKAIDACQTVDCERPPKLEIASALKTYSGGLNKICWPDKYRADVTSLTQANTGMADAFTNWATATTPAQDQSLQSAAKEQDTRQGVADDVLSHDLGVPLATPAPS
jgi:hypothetical protein